MQSLYCAWFIRNWAMFCCHVNVGLVAAHPSPFCDHEITRRWCDGDDDDDDDYGDDDDDDEHDGDDDDDDEHDDDDAADGDDAAAADDDDAADDDGDDDGDDDDDDDDDDVCYDDCYGWEYSIIYKDQSGEINNETD